MGHRHQWSFSYTRTANGGALNFYKCPDCDYRRMEAVFGARRKTWVFHKSGTGEKLVEGLEWLSGWSV